MGEEKNRGLSPVKDNNYYCTEIFSALITVPNAWAHERTPFGCMSPQSDNELISRAPKARAEKILTLFGEAYASKCPLKCPQLA